MSAAAPVAPPAAAAAPLVSVVIPSFNQGRFLRATLDSIFSQDWRPLEIVVMDGASKDDTVAILQEYAARHPELRWWSEPDAGPADAVNKGLARATGRWAVIQSSDDVFYPGAIRAAVEVLQAHPDCAMAYGDCDSFEDGGPRHARTQLPEFSWEFFFGKAFCLPQGSILFDLALARELGGWRGEIYACDLDFWMRLAFRTKPRKVPHLMYGWRRYPDQRTRPDRHAKILAGYDRMIGQSPELAGAPELRRLAEASRHIMAVRFPATESVWQRRWHLLQASRLAPSHWRYAAQADTWALLPGFALAARVTRPLRRLLRRPAP